MTAEQKKFMTLDEAAAYVGIKRATIYNYMKDLKIEPHKFGRDRRSYISLADVQRIKTYKEEPWKLANQTGEEVA